MLAVLAKMPKIAFAYLLFQAFAFVAAVVIAKELIFVLSGYLNYARFIAQNYKF